eukprot:m.163068 g.163068  ORF g.163068 m.163068 type:complete len:1223 (-) comp15212_c0_seq1:1475-5143(-)
MKLSNGDLLPLANPTFSLDPSVNIEIAQDVVTPSVAGDFDAHCAFGGESTQEHDKLLLNVLGLSDGAVPSSITAFNVEQDDLKLTGEVALRGKIDASTAISVVSVLLNDGRRYNQQKFHTTPNSFLPNLFVFSGGSMTTGSVESNTGIVTLRGTSPDSVQFKVETNGPVSVSATTMLPTNVDCITDGDVDLGAIDGVAMPNVQAGDNIALPVRMNTAGKPLGSFDMYIDFVSSVLDLNGNLEIDDENGAIQLTDSDRCAAQAIRVSTGLRIVGSCDSLTSIVSDIDFSKGRANWAGVLFGTIRLRAISAGQSVVTGRVNIMTDALLQSPIAGSSSAFNFTAGDLVQIVTGSRRVRARALSQPDKWKSMKLHAADKSRRQSALFIVGDTDLGFYGSSPRGTVNALDVACIMQFVSVVNTKCLASQKKLNEGFSLSIAAQTHWQEVCCYLSGIACPPVDSVSASNLLERKTVEAYLQLNAQTWTSFTDLNLDGRLGLGDALYLIRAIVGRLPLIQSSIVGSSPVEVTGPNSSCGIQASINLYYPAPSLPFCIAMQGPSAGCADLSGMSLSQGIDIQLLAAAKEINATNALAWVVNHSDTMRSLSDDTAGMQLVLTSTVPIENAEGEISGVELTYSNSFETSAVEGSATADMAIAVSLLEPSASSFEPLARVQYVPALTDASRQLFPSLTSLIPSSWSTNDQIDVSVTTNDDSDPLTLPLTCVTNLSIPISKATASSVSSLQNDSSTVPMTPPDLMTITTTTVNPMSMNASGNSTESPAAISGDDNSASKLLPLWIILALLAVILLIGLLLWKRKQNKEKDMEGVPNVSSDRTIPNTIYGATNDRLMGNAVYETSFNGTDSERVLGNPNYEEINSGGVQGRTLANATYEELQGESKGETRVLNNATYAETGNLGNMDRLASNETYGSLAPSNIGIDRLASNETYTSEFGQDNVTYAEVNEREQTYDVPELAESNYDRLSKTEEANPLFLANGNMQNGSSGMYDNADYNQAIPVPPVIYVVKQNKLGGMGNVYRVEYNKEEDGFVDLSSGDIFVPKKTLSDSSLLEESSSDDLFLASLRPPKHADDDDGYLEFLGEDMEGTETPLVRVNGEEKSQLVRIEMTRRRRHSSLKLPFEQQELTAEKKKKKNEFGELRVASVRRSNPLRPTPASRNVTEPKSMFTFGEDEIFQVQNNSEAPVSPTRIPGEIPSPTTRSSSYTEATSPLPP